MDQADKWKVLEALTSGEHRQVRGHFYETADGTEGCAVGIMAEALGFDRRRWFHTAGLIYGRNERNHPFIFLATKGFPLPVLQRIVELNDDQRMSFARIARWLSAHLGAHEPLVKATPTPAWVEQLEHFANEAKLLVNA